MSDLQNHLESLYKSRVLPQDKYLAINDNNNQIKISRTFDDLEKSELFITFFWNVFKVDGQILSGAVYENKENNFIKLSEDEIKETLSSLDANKACGPDNIGNTVLENISDLSKLHLLVFHTCTDKWPFSSQWKVSEVMPSYKDNDKADIGQYRSISLPTNVSKLFGRVIFLHLYPIIGTQLDKRQFGFCHNRSAVPQLLLCPKEVNERYNAENSQHIYAI